MSMEKPAPQKLSEHLFGDVSPASIDWEQHAHFVIVRVLMSGALRDWHAIKKFYGVEKIKNEALQARYLDHLTLHFCSTYFHIPVENFRCSTTPPSIQKLWDY
jgi:hypothetical protein